MSSPFSPLSYLQYLGTYLLSYVKAMETEASTQASQAKADQLEAELKQKTEDQAAQAKAAEDAQSALQKEEDDLANELANVDSAVIDKILALLVTRTSATGCYYGRKETTSAGVSQIQYINSTQDVMKGSVLKGVADGEEEGAEGSTWPIFVSSEVEETVVDPETGDESTVTKTVFPEDVSVENVVRDASTKCFGLPKLGAYYAVPVRYNSCLHENGVEDAPPAPEPVEPAEGEEPAPVEAREFEKFAPVYTTAEFIIGLDTVGQGRCFTNNEKELVKNWGIKLAEASAAAELANWKVDVAALEEFATSETDPAAAKEAAAAGAAEKLGALGEDISEDAKALSGAQFNTAAAAEVLDSVKAQILTIGGFNLTPKPETLKVFAAAMSMVGYENGSFTDELTGKSDWSKMRSNIGEELFEKIAAFDATTIDAAKLEKIRGDAEGLDEAGVPLSHIVAASSSVGVLLGWVNAAGAGVDAQILFKQKEDEAAAAAAESAEA